MPSRGRFLTDTKAKQGSERKGQEKGVPRDLGRKSKRESHVLPKELEVKQ